MDRDNAAAAYAPRCSAASPCCNEFQRCRRPVAIASDNTRDPFYAYGDLDALEVLREGARILHFDHPQDEAWAWARAIRPGSRRRSPASPTQREIAVGAPR